MKHNPSHTILLKNLYIHIGETKLMFLECLLALGLVLVFTETIMVSLSVSS